MNLASVQKKLMGIVCWHGWHLVLWPLLGSIWWLYLVQLHCKYEIFNTIDTAQTNGTDELDEKFSDWQNFTWYFFSRFIISPASVTAATQTVVSCKNFQQFLLILYNYITGWGWVPVTHTCPPPLGLTRGRGCYITQCFGWKCFSLVCKTMFKHSITFSVCTILMLEVEPLLTVENFINKRAEFARYFN